MKSTDTTELFTLAALWSGSFVFMRLRAGEFGALPLTVRFGRTDVCMPLQ